MQRADEVAPRGAAAALHQRLPMAADVGQQLHALLGAHEHATLAFLRQGVEVADLRDGGLVCEVARDGLEDQLHLACVHAGIEIGGNRELGATALQCLEGNTQVGHDPQDLQKPMSNRSSVEGDVPMDGSSSAVPPGPLPGPSLGESPRLAAGRGL